MKKQSLDSLRKTIRQASKIVHEICSRPKPIENCRPCLLFRTDILQKTVVFGNDCVGPCGAINAK